MSSADIAQKQQTSTPTVLLVDDEQNILSSLRRLLRPAGYNVFVAQSGAEGLSILEKENIDLVISDMRMPEMDGAELLEKVAETWPDTMRILLTGYADMTSTVAAINKGKIYEYLSKPWDDDELKISVQHALERKMLEEDRRRLQDLTQKQNNELQDLNENLELKVKVRTEELGQAMGQLEKANESLKTNYLATIKVFSNLAEMREGSSTGHSRRVADLSRKVAEKMEMSSDEIQNVFIAGLLHDIGKVGLPDKIIDTPYNSLNMPDKQKFHKHTIIGEGILMGLEPLHEVATLIRGHHERYDGKGYPDNLSADDIPLGSRILSLVNDYESLRQGKLTKDSLSSGEIREFIQTNKNKRYDPNIVTALFEVLGAAPLKKKERIISVMSNGLEEGMVLARDIVSDEEVLLLAEGQVLTDNMIQRIQRYEQSIEDELAIFVRQ